VLKLMDKATTTEIATQGLCRLRSELERLHGFFGFRYEENLAPIPELLPSCTGSGHAGHDSTSAGHEILRAISVVVALS